MTRRHPLLIGHRGAPGYLPEHTRSSYELAIAAGMDAVEPDLVLSRDGVLVIRHENEIGSTTDVADHPEFADRRTTRTVDGETLTGWFTEDFTWDELATLRCRERLPELRPESAAFDDQEPMLRLRDLLDLLRAVSEETGRDIVPVLEIKHATYFSFLGRDVAALLVAELDASGWTRAEAPVVFESFEPTVLDELRERGIRGSRILLLAASGSPADLVARDGEAAPTYAELARPEGLDGLVGRFDGISVDKAMILAPDAEGRPTGPSRIVADAHERALLAYTWTCRPENAFLSPAFRSGDDPATHGDYAAEWALIRDAGVDGVFADHPDLAVEVFRD